jgi:hypothetical protein
VKFTKMICMAVLVISFISVGRGERGCGVVVYKFMGILCEHHILIVSPHRSALQNGKKNDDIRCTVFLYPTHLA